MPSSLADKTVATMLELLAIDSPSGHEEKVRIHCVDRLLALGLTVDVDGKGNILGRLEASKGMEQASPVLLNCHMDTVPSAVQVRPSIVDGIFKSDGTTALGADDKAGIAAIFTALEVINDQQLSHGPLLVLLTVSEEIGLEGAKAFDMQSLGRIGRGYTLDASGKVGTAIISAPSKSDATIIFHGRASHAGFAPEAGISAISLAAKAIDGMKLLRIDTETTANIGTIHGGEVTNIVCDRCEVTLEVRSSTSERVNRHLAHLEFCCIKAVGALGGSYEFMPVELYPGYSIGKDAPELNYFEKVCKRLGLPFAAVPTGGGSDANIMRNQGIPVITLGIGYSGAHTLTESIVVQELENLTRLVVALCEPGEMVSEART